MAYQHDPDGPVVDKGALRAFILEKLGIILLGAIVLFILIKIFHTDSDKYEDALDLVKINLRHSQYNYSIEDSDKALAITLWSSGITSIAKQAYNGDTAALSDWSKVKDSILGIIHTVENDFILCDIKDVSLTVILVNEDNHNRALLVYKNDVIVYDIVNDKEGG